MVKAAQSKPEINIDLMPGRQEPAGTTGTAVHWALTIGRFLVIGTEIIAIAIFALSVKLSADKQDLKESIKSLTSIVSAQEDFEKDFRTTQNRINEVRNKRLNHFLSNKLLSEFLGLLPTGMTLDSLDVKDGEMAFSGSFASPKELQTLISSFSKSEKIVGLNIIKLAHPTESSKEFKFSASAIIISSQFEEGTNGTN